MGWRDRRRPRAAAAAAEPEPAGRGARRRRLPRGLVALVGLVVVLAAAVVLGGGWYYSDRVLPAPVHTDGPLDDPVTVAGSDVTLAAGALACLDALGLRAADGAYATLAPPDGGCPAGGSVTRTARVLAGTLPSGRIPADLDPYVFGPDPAALGLPFAEVTVPTPLGPAPAWFVPGTRPQLVVFVHGRGGDRREGLRLLSVTADLGYPGLLISYRNDGVAPATEDGVGRYGTTEWEDLDAALTWAREQGSAEFVLAGFSQGGALIGSLERNGDVSGVRGAILDAPLLQLGSTLELQARGRDLPGPLIPPILLGTRWISLWRAGLDVGAVAHTDLAARLDRPVLLFHGTADETVPITSSDRLAATSPELVTYVRVPDAGHVRAFNVDPDGYREAVTAFLAGL